VSAGPGKFADGKLNEVSVKAGSVVMLPEYGGMKVKVEDEEKNVVYKMYRDEDIMAIIEG